MQEIMCYRGYMVSKDRDWYEVSYREMGVLKTEICENFYEAMKFIHDKVGWDYFNDNFLELYEEEAI